MPVYVAQGYPKRIEMKPKGNISPFSLDTDDGFIFTRTSWPGVRYKAGRIRERKLSYLPTPAHPEK
jgi:hypothetical protein